LLPPQGTLYWSVVRVWEDGTHDIIVPAVRDAMGCGDDFESALADAREKLAVRVQNCVKEGRPVKVLGKEATELSLKDDMDILTQQCKALGMEVPTLSRSELRQIDFLYNNNNNNNNKSLKRFPAHDELGTSRTSLVSPEQPVLCIPIRPTNTTVLTIT